MPHTHHATRKFRLSCGCLRDYPGMAAGKRHSVLCTSCGIAATTVYDYPDRRCGSEALVSTVAGRIRVSCTNEPGNEYCKDGVHADELAGTTFTATPPVRKGAWGNTGRA